MLPKNIVLESLACVKYLRLINVSKLLILDDVICIFHNRDLLPVCKLLEYHFIFVHNIDCN